MRDDFESYFNAAVPEDARYWTHTIEGPDDMPAHIKASLLGPSLTLPVSGGRLATGTWQGIYLCEHRDHGGAALAGPDPQRGVDSAEERERGLALAAQLREVDLDPGDPARLGQHARLRLDDLRRQHAAAVRLARVQPDPLEVAGELLDGVDRPDRA